MSDEDFLSAEDIEAGYPAFCIGFERGARFAFADAKKSIDEFINAVVLGLPALSIDKIAKAIAEEVNFVPPEYEDYDGDQAFSAWRRVHARDPSSPAAAENWNSLIPKLK